jgi:hypothetical protein
MVHPFSFQFNQQFLADDPPAKGERHDQRQQQ